MSILEDLATKGAEKAKSTWDTQGGKWFDNIISQANNTASQVDDPIVKASAIAGLEVLAKHKDNLLHLGSDGLLAVVGFLALGSTQRAEHLLFLRQIADLDTLFAASDAADAKVLAAKNAEDKAKAAVAAIFKEVTITVAKTVLPLLLAAI